MKYIFDFDDVIFDSGKFKEERLFTQLKEIGISDSTVRELYRKGFSSPRDLYMRSFKNSGYICDTSTLDVLENNLYENIDTFLHKDVVHFLHRVGKSNCTVLSAGDYEFQNKKIKETGIADLVAQVVLVSQSKKEWVLEYVVNNKDEMIYFIDNTEGHLTHPEFKEHKNLKTVLYTNPKDLPNI